MHKLNPLFIHYTIFIKIIQLIIYNITIFYKSFIYGKDYFIGTNTMEVYLKADTSKYDSYDIVIHGGSAPAQTKQGDLNSDKKVNSTARYGCGYNRIQRLAKSSCRYERRQKSKQHRRTSYSSERS